MYYEVIQQFTRSLTNLDRILGKAVHHAELKKFDPNNFMTMRLAPDMFTFAKQVQIACDVAKATAGNLSGKDIPKHEDTETTLPDLRARIQKTLAYLRGFSPADFKSVDPKKRVKIPFPQGKAMDLQDYLFSRSIPNLFFHMTAAYSLLRLGGVDIGKNDFLGELNLFDA